MAERSSAVRIAVVYPELLGTYGDGGNAVILAQRLGWRGIDAELVTVELGRPVASSCDLYVLGGGEDAPQALASAELSQSGALSAAVDHGAAVLAVCAGLQVVGRQFLAGGHLHPGVGLVDVRTTRALPHRAVGELVVRPQADHALPVLSGYENHAGATELGPGVRPLGWVEAGVGNGGGSGDGAGDGVDGVIAGRVLGTYLHGPVLARNPEVADLLLSWVIGVLPEGDERLATADREAGELRRERLRAVLSRPRVLRRRRRSVRGQYWRGT
jgi:CobQ-like glutamine amidotransferase family enzyme